MLLNCRKVVWFNTYTDKCDHFFCCSIQLEFFCWLVGGDLFKGSGSLLIL